MAGEYARRFPQHLQAIALDSAAPLEELDMLERLPHLALERVLREVCFPPGCRGAFGRSEASRLAGAARALPRDDEADLWALVRLSDADPLVRSELPSALDAIRRRDPAPLRRLARHVRRAPRRVARTAAAGDLTLRDAIRWASAQEERTTLRGLRGGRLVVGEQTVRLAGYRPRPLPPG